MPYGRNSVCQMVRFLIVSVYDPKVCWLQPAMPMRAVVFFSCSICMIFVLQTSLLNVLHRILILVLIFTLKAETEQGPVFIDFITSAVGI